MLAEFKKYCKILFIDWNNEISFSLSGTILNCSASKHVALQEQKFSRKVNRNYEATKGLFCKKKENKHHIRNGF